MNKYFLDLMQDQGMVKCVDPPSNRLNAAKLERQFSYTSGLICVLPNRNSGPSKYIISEIQMAARSGKPTLVFTEDTLPGQIFPNRVLHDRFQRNGFWRHATDHIEKIEAFSRLTGSTLRPRIRNPEIRRSVVLLGFSNLHKDLAKGLISEIERRDYLPVPIEDLCQSDDEDANVYAALRDCNFVVACVDRLSTRDSFLLGYIRAAVIPTIMVEVFGDCRLFRKLPQELGPRRLPRHVGDAVAIVQNEIDIFEDEALDIDQHGEIDDYIEFLKSASRRPGNYDSELRNVFIQNNRDVYNVARAKAVGNEAKNSNGES